MQIITEEAPQCLSDSFVEQLASIGFSPKCVHVSFVG